MTEEVMDDPVREQLAAFLEGNPESEYVVEEGQRRIKRPWGDSTLEIQIPEDDAGELIAMLNSLYLPPRFTALWHRDSEDLEMIWTAMPVGEELRTRSFDFRFRDRSYRCEYAPASRSLCALARASRPVEPPSSTGYRNLSTFQLRQLRAELSRSNGDTTEPTSFYIRSLPWDENAVVELAHHVNFYMCYFDRQSPVIVIHEMPSGGAKVTGPQRYPLGDFPELISGRALDPYLLALWDSTFSVSPFLCFLHGYQILEYAAFYFLREGVLQTVKRILCSPDVLARPNEAVRQVVDAVVEDRMGDAEKMVAVVKQVVDPEALWREIEPNIEYFCRDVDFDGGATLAALLNPGSGVEDFRKAWIPKFPEALRKLRNGIVHAREQRGPGGILPTRANSERIAPWLAPLSVAAVQTILYRETL